MQFPFLPVGVKWKVVKNVHCPLLLINTGLMSIGPLTKKLLQKKNAQWAIAEKVHFRHGPLLNAQWCTYWCTLRRLVRASAYYIEWKLWKIRLWHMINFILLAVTLFRFFWGKPIWSYCRLSLNVSQISKTKLSVFRLSNARARARRTHTVF